MQVKCNDEGILQCTHVYACKRAHLYGPSAALPSCCNCKLKLAWYLVTSPEHTLQCAAWIARETPAHSCCSACCMHVSGILLSCAVHMYSLSRSKSSLLPHNVGSGAALTILQLTHTQLDSLAGLAALRGVQPVLIYVGAVMNAPELELLFRELSTSPDFCTLIRSIQESHTTDHPQQLPDEKSPNDFEQAVAPDDLLCSARTLFEQCQQMACTTSDTTLAVKGLTDQAAVLVQVHRCASRRCV